MTLDEITGGCPMVPPRSPAAMARASRPQTSSRARASRAGRSPRSPTKCAVDAGKRAHIVARHARHPPCRTGLHELLTRNLQEVFGEGDAARRRAAIDQLYTEDCVLYAPPGVLVGRDALDTFAGELRASHPHFVYAPHGEPQALHNAGRLAWGSGPRGGKPEYTGLDVIITRGDKIAALYVFLDSIPS